MIRWLIVIGYFLAIFFFSSQSQSGASYMHQWLRQWFPSLSGAEIQNMVYYLRKGGHVAAYGLATILTYYATRFTPKIKRLPLLFTLALVFALAGIDEWYQTTLPHRSGVLQDVFIDGLGIGVATIGILGHRWLERRRQRRKSKTVG